VGRADRRRARQGQRRTGGLAEHQPLTTAGQGRVGRGTLGLPLLLATLAGGVVAGYLSAARIAGEAAVCGPSRGCETVAASEYSAIAGIPVAFLGLGASVALILMSVLWWRRAERGALTAAYLLLLLSTLFVAYLTYLELFVIEAVCAWCVAYAVTIVVSLVVAGLALRRSSGPAPGA
jgi:uncharacterized membrane protein